MTKTTNKFSSLAQIEFVEDIDQEAAANYSGGNNDGPDVILYEDGDFGGRSVNLNYKIYEGSLNLNELNFNDKTSSFKIIRGTWSFYTDNAYKGSNITLGPGSYSGLQPIDNDKITSVRRAGA